MKKLSLALLGLLAVAGSETALCRSLSGQYWFDFSAEHHPFETGSLEIPTDGLAEGIHTLNAYVEDESGLSAVSSAWFVKGTSIMPGTQLTANIFIDGSPRNNLSLTVGPAGNIPFDLDVMELPLGVHTLGTQIITPSAAVAGFRETVFLRVPSTAELGSMRGYYTIDDVVMGSVDTRIGGNTYSLDIDASALSSGIHSVTVYLASKYGISTSPVSACFLKIPQGGEGVKSYRYWLNENEDEAVSVNLDKVSNPFRLVELIGVKEQPFASTHYTFAIENGDPMVMSRNTFHFVTFDADGRMTVGQKDYTDPRVKRNPGTVGSLVEDGSRTELPRLAENEIKFYSFEGEIGDSIAIRLDCAGMVEVYSPSGETLIASSGAEALTYSSSSLTANGTYYIAIHDYNSPAGVYFDHVGKFAVCSFTPGHVSKYGPVLLNVTGNGFRSLEEAEFAVSGNTVGIDKISVADNYRMTLTVGSATGSELPTGSYDLTLKFRDPETGERESITLGKILTVEEPVDRGMVVDVDCPRITGTPYEFYVTVKNNSNTPALLTPLNIAAEDDDRGYSISFMDFAVESHNAADEPDIYATDNLIGTDAGGQVVSAVIPYIGPYETVRLKLGLDGEAHQKISFHAWVADPLNREFREILSDGYDITRITKYENENIFSARSMSYYYALAKEITDSELETLVSETSESGIMATKHGCVRPLTTDVEGMRESVLEIYQALNEAIAEGTLSLTPEPTDQSALIKDMVFGSRPSAPAAHSTVRALPPLLPATLARGQYRCCLAQAT